MRDTLYALALYSQSDFLRQHAKLLKRARQITHTQALDALAVSLSYRDWQHLTFETQQAWHEYIICTPRDAELHQLKLPTLCLERPDLIIPVIEKLAVELFKDLFATLLTKQRYAARAADGGDNNILFDDKSFPGWRLCVDEPGGYVFFSQYPARGKLIAIIDGSVSGERIQEFMPNEGLKDIDWELARAEAREYDRQMDLSEVVLNHTKLSNPISAPHQLMKSCYEAIQYAMVTQCSISIDDDYADDDCPF